MKKFYLIAAMALATVATNAQEKFTLSTYNGTNVTKFDGKVCNVTVNRLLFHGWNTIALPFDVSEYELNEAFGSDCRLERLIGAERSGNSIALNFQDCKSEGIVANTPYILYYTGETGSKRISKEARIEKRQQELSFPVKGSSERVTMAGVQEMTKGVGYYGVLAADNAEAQFVQVDESKNGFFATRCYIAVPGAAQKLITNHLPAGDLTAITAIATDSELVDVFNAAGTKVATQIRASQVNQLKAGIYIVKGHKILVK